jgi:hypothetical protein
LRRAAWPALSFLAPLFAAVLVRIAASWTWTETAAAIVVIFVISVRWRWAAWCD